MLDKSKVFLICQWTIYLQLLFLLDTLKKKLKRKKFDLCFSRCGRVQRTRGLATKIAADLAIIDKRRPAPGKSRVMNIIGDVKGKTCIIVDDAIDSGGTIVNAVAALKKSGAEDVYVFTTHGGSKR